MLPVDQMLTLSSHSPVIDTMISSQMAQGLRGNPVKFRPRTGRPKGAEPEHLSILAERYHIYDAGRWNPGGVPPDPQRPDPGPQQPLTKDEDLKMDDGYELLKGFQGFHGK